MSAPGTPKASQAAITAVQEALGCWQEVARCGEHDWAMPWTERGCPVAVAAADAAAPHNAAQALRDAARNLHFCAADANLLDTLADRIEVGQ